MHIPGALRGVLVVSLFPSTVLPTPPIDTSFIPDTLIANEIFAGFALRNVTDPSGVFTFDTIR